MKNNYQISVKKGQAIGKIAPKYILPEKRILAVNMQKPNPYPLDKSKCYTVREKCIVAAKSQSNSR